MRSPTVLAILNELLSRETRSLAPRLFESTVFISRLSIADHAATQRIAQSNARNCEALAQLIVELGGVPDPRMGNLNTADLHFQELHFALSRLVSDHRALVESYRLAVQRVTGEPRAPKLISDILLQHERELSELNGLLDTPKAKAS